MLKVCAFAAWIMWVFTGRLPRGLFDPMVLASSYIARSDAYWFLLTETYPPIQDEQTRTAGLDDGEQQRAVLQDAPRSRPVWPKATCAPRSSSDR